MPFKVDDAPMPTPEPHEVLIKNYTTAINPVDYGIQDSGAKYVFDHTKTSVIDGLIPDVLLSDVKASTCWGSCLIHNEVCQSVWGKWIPAALADGTLQCNPDPLVICQGLEKIQEACDKQDVTKMCVSGIESCAM